MTKTTLFARESKSNNLSMGIVGLPNTGKSTLFNSLTQSNVPAENYPFCTIDPTKGRVEIDDQRIRVLADKYKPRNVVKAFLSVTDIAGLIKGASTGTGLGNCFLDHIRNVDGIFHVVRCFESNETVHVEDSIDPIRDIKIINDELRYKDKEVLAKVLEKLNKEAKSKVNDKKFREKLDIVKKLLEILESTWINEHLFTEEEVSFVSTLNLLTVKNVVYLANISEREYSQRLVNKHLKAVMGYTKDVIPFSALYEAQNKNERFLSKLIKKGYESLRLINFFTVGADEVRSWTIREGVRAPVAGSVIHTDFMNYFVMAEVMSYDDFVSYGSINKVKEAGKYHQRGKNYVVNDGDIIVFKFNPPKSGKKKK